MKKPLSFKGMLKEKGNPLSALAPRKMPEDLDNKILKDYSNTFKCPFCKCLLDGGGKFNGVITLRCSWNPGHFRVSFNGADVHNIFLIQDNLIFIDIKHKKRYVIDRLFESNKVRVTYLYIYDTDGNGDQIEAKVGKSISLPGNVFNYTDLDEKKLLNAIKTVLVFS